MPNWTEADIDLVLNDESEESEAGSALIADLEDAALDQFQDAVTALSRAVTAMVMEAVDRFGRLLPADTELDPQAEWGMRQGEQNHLYADMESAVSGAHHNRGLLLTRVVRSWASGARYIGAWHVVPEEVIVTDDPSLNGITVISAAQDETDNH